MKYVFALIASLFLVTPVFAGQTTLTTQTKLTDAQEAQLAAQAAKMAADNAAGVTAPETKAAVVKEWVDIGAAVGSGLASSAKELGVAANDFAQTPVGKMTAVLIVWHFMGSTLLHILFGSIWFIVMVPLWIWMFRRYSATYTDTVYETGKGPNGAKRVKTRTPKQMTEMQAVGVTIAGAAIVVVGLVSFFTF